MDQRADSENLQDAAPGFVYRFDDFELDPVRETLTGPMGPVGLRDHALRVLKLLVERAPEVVSRDDILDEVWGHQALSESSISQVIRDIRAALNDPARNPTMLATRYGRGYQFIADVERVEPGAGRSGEPGSEAAADATPESPQRAGLAIRFALVALLAVAAFSAAQWYRGQSALPEAEVLQTITLRAVAPERGEALSAAFVDYLAFIIGNAIGADRVEVAGGDDVIDPSSRVVEISLASLEPLEGDLRERADSPTGRRGLEIAIRSNALDDPEFRLRLDEASDLVRRGLDEILATLERDAEGTVAIQAGLLSQNGFAVETLLRGMTAQLAGDVRRAATLFEAALAEDPDFEFARYELAIALRRDGKTDRSIAILEPMADRLFGDFWQMRINNALGLGYWQLQRYDEALGALRRAYAASDSSATQAAVLTNIGLLERNLERLDQAETTLREAIRLADLAVIGRLRAGARNTLASVLIELDRAEQALPLLDRARELFYEIGDLRGYAAVLSRTARLRSALGERNEPEALLRLALGIREQIDDRAGAVDTRLRLAALERVRGNFEESRSLAAAALEEALALDEDDLVIDGFQALAAIALADRRFEQARSYGNEALRLAELTGREGDERAALLGLLLAEQPSFEARSEFTDRIQALVEAADEAQDVPISIRARVLAARHARSTGQFDDARRVLERARDLLPGNDARLHHEVDAERARLGLRGGDLDTVRDALDRLERENAPPHPTLMLRAKLHAEQGDLTSAVEAAGLARSSVGGWWRADEQALLDRWSEAARR